MCNPLNSTLHVFILGILKNLFLLLTVPLTYPLSEPVIPISHTPFCMEVPQTIPYKQCIVLGLSD